MSREVVHTDRAPGAVGPYSQAIKAGGILFVSGQIGIDPQTGALMEGLSQQAEQVLKNLTAVCEAAGTTVQRAAKLTVYVTDIASFPLINEMMSRYFAEEPPARATVEVSALPLQALVEMDAVIPLAG